VTSQSYITHSAKSAQPCALLTGFFAFGENYVRDYSCPGPTDTINFQLQDIWAGISPYELMTSSVFITRAIAALSWHWIEKSALTLKGKFR
jgi:hypothetical protein